MTTATTPRDHLALALDVGDLDDALAVRANACQPWFGIAKVGFELYAEAGPDAFEALRDKGFRVFADLKLHDIPTTVERGARATRASRRRVPQLPRRGWRRRCCAPGVDGLREGARDAGHARTDRARGHRAHERSERRRARDARCDAAANAGCDGVVCAGTDVDARARARACARWCPASDSPGGDAHDQARVDTPGDAIARGADWLVIGRSGDRRPTIRSVRPKRLRAMSAAALGAHCRVEPVVSENVACVY